VKEGYYYFIATLPSLSYGQDVPMSSASFVESCHGLLPESDAALLKYCRLDVAGFDWAGEGKDDAAQKTPSDFINMWIGRESALCRKLAELRAAKLGWGRPDFVMQDASLAQDAEASANQAFNAGNALEGELSIDKGRWDAIETAAGIEIFNINTIYAYLLKLQLMERRSLFKPDEGFAESKAIYAGILEKAPKAGEGTENRK
jgi:hypothetical protein